MYLDSNTDHLVKTMPCVLRRLIIGTPGGSGNKAEIFDGDSSTGTKKAEIKLDVAPASLKLDIVCGTKLTVKMSGGTAGKITAIVD